MSKTIWKFVTHLVSDMMLWVVMAVAAFGSEMSKTYANNALTFYFAFIFVLSVIMFLVGQKSAEHSVSSGKYVKRAKAHARYAVISTICEVTFAAAMGWFWFATVMLVSAFATRFMYYLCDELLEAPTTTD